MGQPLQPFTVAQASGPLWPLLEWLRLRSFPAKFGPSARLAREARFRGGIPRAEDRFHLHTAADGAEFPVLRPSKAEQSTQNRRPQRYEKITDLVGSVSFADRRKLVQFVLKLVVREDPRATDVRRALRVSLQLLPELLHLSELSHLPDLSDLPLA